MKILASLLVLGLLATAPLVADVSSGTGAQDEDSRTETIVPVFVAGVDSGGAGARVVEEPNQLHPGNIINTDCQDVGPCNACVFKLNDWCSFRVCNAGPC